MGRVAFISFLCACCAACAPLPEIAPQKLDNVHSIGVVALIGDEIHTIKYHGLSIDVDPYTLAHDTLDYAAFESIRVGIAIRHPDWKVRRVTLPDEAALIEKNTKGLLAQYNATLGSIRSDLAPLLADEPVDIVLIIRTLKTEVPCGGPADHFRGMGLCKPPFDKTNSMPYVAFNIDVWDGKTLDVVATRAYTNAYYGQHSFSAEVTEVVKDPVQRTAFLSDLEAMMDRGINGILIGLGL
jgi:hypothetical protein